MSGLNGDRYGRDERGTRGEGSGGDNRDGRMGTTPPGLVGGLIVLGVAFGWGLSAVLGDAGFKASAVPWSAGALLAFFAGLLGLGAWFMYDRVHRKSQRVDPLLAFRLLVLGKASAVAGALVGGAYTGVAVRFLTTALPENQSLVWPCAAAALAGYAVLVAALLLERACKVPKSKSDEPEDPDEPQEPEASV